MKLESLIFAYLKESFCCKEVNALGKGKKELGLSPET